MKVIIVNRKALPIHFGMKAIDEFSKSQGIDFSETATSTTFAGSLETIVSLALVGLNEGARRSGKEERFCEDDIWDMFDEDPGLILQISEIFANSIVPLTDKLGGMLKNGKRPTAEKKATP